MGREGKGEGRDGKEGEGKERGCREERPGKWSAPGPALALGGPAYRQRLKRVNLS